MASFQGEKETPSLLRAAYSGDLNQFKRNVKEVERTSQGITIGEALGKVRDEKGATALHFGAVGGRTQVCKYLIKDLQFHVDVRDAEDTTPLHQAILGGHHPTAVYLLENGASPNATSKKGCTALHYAAKQGLKKLIQLLISKGAEINAMSDSGTPLQMAAAEGRKDAVKILLNNHADPNAILYCTFSPLLVAILAKSYECIKLLLQAGADPNICSGRASPLEMAVEEGASEIIKCLLAAGANPNNRNSFDLTPLEVAAIEGKHEEVLVLFPATAPIAGITDWSPAGIMKYVRTNEAKRKMEKKRKEEFLLSKSQGEAAFKKENYIEAIYSYTKCINLEPLDATVLSNRSLCWARLNEGERALSDARACVSLKPEWPKAYYREGVAWRLLKDFRRSTNSFLAGWQLDTTNEELKSAFIESLEAQAEANKSKCYCDFERELKEAYDDV